MAKHVFKTDEIPHLWAHKVQDSARNSQGNLYFNGDTIYSYRDSFPIGRHVTSVIGDIGILITTDTYSVTTSGHISAVRMSVPHGVQVFNVAFSRGRLDEQWVQAQLTRYAENIPKLLLKAKRARTNGDWYLRDAAAMHAEALAFARFYDFDNPKIPALDMDVSVLEAAIKAARADERKQAKVKQAALLVSQADAIAAWRIGADAGYFDRYNLPTMLRVKGDVVETSRGVSFPIDHARKALVLVRAVMARGEDWHTNGHTCHLGHYRLDRITKAGTVHAGCHVVTWDEIEKVAALIENGIAAE